MKSRDEISAAAVPPGQRVSLIDVARKAGVSRSTASLVLRGSDLVADGTRERVTEAMQALGYVYHRGAAMLREGRTRTIGLLVNDIANPYVANFVSFLDQSLERDGQVALLANSAESVTRQEQVLLRLREHSVDGVVLSPAAGSTEALLDGLDAWRTPYVQALRYVSTTRGDYAGPDYAEAMRIAVTHLADLGHARIAYIGGGVRDHSAMRERTHSYQSEMSRRHLSPTQHKGGVTGRDGADAVRDLMRDATPPTAIICYNDGVALGAMSELLRQGRQPGRDVAVVGIDDIPASASVWPTLTTVATGMQEIGAAAVELLTRRLAEPQAPWRREVVKPTLIIRQSCGALS